MHILLMLSYRYTLIDMHIHNSSIYMYVDTYNLITTHTNSHQSHTSHTDIQSSTLDSPRTRHLTPYSSL